MIGEVKNEFWDKGDYGVAYDGDRFEVLSTEWQRHDPITFRLMLIVKGERGRRLLSAHLCTKRAHAPVKPMGKRRIEQGRAVLKHFLKTLHKVAVDANGVAWKVSDKGCYRGHMFHVEKIIARPMGIFTLVTSNTCVPLIDAKKASNHSRPKWVVGDELTHQWWGKCRVSTVRDDIQSLVVLNSLNQNVTVKMSECERVERPVNAQNIDKKTAVDLGIEPAAVVYCPPGVSKEEAEQLLRSPVENNSRPEWSRGDWAQCGEITFKVDEVRPPQFRDSPMTLIARLGWNRSSDGEPAVMQFLAKHCKKIHSATGTPIDASLLDSSGGKAVSEAACALASQRLEAADDDTAGQDAETYRGPLYRPGDLVRNRHGRQMIVGKTRLIDGRYQIAEFGVTGHFWHGTDGMTLLRSAA